MLSAVNKPIFLFWNILDYISEQFSTARIEFFFKHFNETDNLSYLKNIQIVTYAFHIKLNAKPMFLWKHIIRQTVTIPKLSRHFHVPDIDTYKAEVEGWFVDLREQKWTSVVQYWGGLDRRCLAGGEAIDAGRTDLITPHKDDRTVVASRLLLWFAK